MSSSSTQTPGLDYQVRINRRARRPQLKLSPAGQLIVVLPRPLEDRLVLRLLNQHRHWIDSRLAAFHARIERSPHILGHVPQEIILPAVQRTWRLEYGCRLDGRRHWQARGDSLLLAAQAEYAGPLLCRWLHGLARQELSTWLGRISTETGLVYRSLTVRAQKTRWGSCSVNGGINLNRNLLFLSPELVDYLLVHELCHTRHHNHSPQYWALVAQHRPDYRALDRQLRAAQQHVPLWALPGSQAGASSSGLRPGKGA